jgi:TPR repeat protein
MASLTIMASSDPVPRGAGRIGDRVEKAMPLAQASADPTTRRRTMRGAVTARTIRTLARTAAPVILAFGLAGCPDYQEMARQELERQGYAEVALTGRSETADSYDVTATKGGIPCKGAITVLAMAGSKKASFDVQVACKAPEDPSKKAPEDPHAADRKLCEEGGLDACTRLGVALTEGPTAHRDLPKAREVSKKACDGGKHPSCVHLGFLHLRGLGGPQSEPEAEALFQKACDAGDAKGCGHLGRVRYINRQFSKALPLFEKACQDGDFAGCVGLGEMTKEGLGVKKADPERARDLFQIGCDGGDMSGCANLGGMYLTGEGGVQNVERAREALKKACDAEVAVACMNLRKLPRE